MSYKLYPSARVDIASAKAAILAQCLPVRLVSDFYLVDSATSAQLEALGQSFTIVVFDPQTEREQRWDWEQRWREIAATDAAQLKSARLFQMYSVGGRVPRTSLPRMDGEFRDFLLVCFPDDTDAIEHHFRVLAEQRAS